MVFAHQFIFISTSGTVKAKRDGEQQCSNQCIVGRIARGRLLGGAAATHEEGDARGNDYYIDVFLESISLAKNQTEQHHRYRLARFE